MRNRDHWAPSKFRFENGRLRSSREDSDVGTASWLLADAVAGCYGQYIPRFVRGRLIDLGCGKAPLYEAYRGFVSDVVWVDWDATLHKNPELDLVFDLTGPMPFADGEFDTIILSDVLEHIPTPEAFFGEMARILSSAGKLLMNVPFLYQIHEAPHDYFRYTEFALRRFAEMSGFEVLVLRSLGGSTEVFADMLAKHLQFLPIAGQFLAGSVQVMAGRLGRTGLGRRVYARSAHAYPLGYFMVAERRTLS